MVDFPNGTPSLPDIVLNDSPGAAAGGLGLRPLINRANDNVLALINAMYQDPVTKFSPIINGGPIYWPDNTSFTSAASGLYPAEGWRYLKAGAVVHDILRSTDVPAVGVNTPKIAYSIHLDVTTVDSSIAAGDFCALEYLMEGWLWSLLAQRQFTIRFWVKAAKTGIHCVAFRNSGNDRTYVAEYTINNADTWEEKSITVPASPSAGTWDYLTGTGIRIDFALSVGSTFQTTANAWNTGNFLGTANQVNETDNTANNFRICGLSAAPGPYCGPYVSRGYALEKLLSQRYYRKTYVDGQPVATATTSGMVGFTMSNSGATNLTFSVQLPVSMRSVPTVTLWDGVGTVSQFRKLGLGTDHAGITATLVTEHGFNVVNSTTATEDMFFHYRADARLT